MIIILAAIVGVVYHFLHMMGMAPGPGPIEPEE
jgi:hypothetical protein